MSGTAQTWAQTLASFADGGAPGNETPLKVRNFIATTQVNAPNYIYAAAPPYNVVADGVTDQTANLQSALTAAATSGATVLLPMGVTIINGTGITVPAGVTLLGQGNARVYQGNTTQGSVLSSPNASYASGTNPVVTLSGNTSMRCLTIQGAGSDGYGNGTTRPCMFAASGSNLTDDVTLTNGYVGYNCNYVQQEFFYNSRVGGNQTGITNPVDSAFTACILNSNGIDIYLAAGANHNRFTANRLEFCGTGASVVIDGSFGWSSTAATNGTTAAGNGTLHFASAPAGALQGYLIYDQTAPAVIPVGTYVTNASPSTSTTMSANAAGAGVGSGDTILFYINQVQDNVFVGNQWDRAFLNAMNIKFSTGTVISGNIFNRGGAGATANTGNDAEIQIFANNNLQITGNTMRTNAADNGTGANSPSFGIWDAGANFNTQIKNNSIVWNPVDGTHGAGINITTNFANFTTDNVVTRASLYIKGQP